MNAKPLLIALTGIVGLQSVAIIGLFVTRQPRNSPPATPLSSPLGTRHEPAGASVPAASFAAPSVEKSIPWQVPVPASSTGSPAAPERELSPQRPPTGASRNPPIGTLAANPASAKASAGLPAENRPPRAILSGNVGSSASQSVVTSATGQAVSSANDGGSAQPPAFPAATSAEAASPLLTPAALAPQDETIPITTDQQVAEWEKLQEDFVTAVGGAEQDLNDPASRDRWTEAQRESDDKFRAKFGWQAFLQQNIQAGRQANGQ